MRTFIFAPSSANLHHSWDLFFTLRPDVARVIVFEDATGISDIEVYFTDSEEVFPYSSLRHDSPLKLGIDKLLSGAFA